MSTAKSPLRVLHAGPLDSIHLRHWVDLTIELGHEVTVAGHLRPGFRSAVAPATEPHLAPQLAWASTRRAQHTDRTVDRALAALPNAAVEVPLSAAWLRRLVERVRPQLIHAHWLPHWGAAAALAGGPPVVAGALGSDVYLQRGLRRQLARLAIARADVVLAPSPHAAALISSRSPRGERVIHLEQGIDLEAFRPPSPGERSAARARLGLGPGPVVLSFRSAAAVYDLPLVAGAFLRLLARRPDAQLLIAHGSAPLDHLTAAALSTAGRSIRIVGQASQEEMRSCFHAAEVGVSVPSSDGSPNSVWESLACATPVVCSGLPQLRERVGPDEGLVFAAREPETVARSLEAVIAHPPRARALGAAGRRWCEANVDRCESLRRVDALYRDVVTGTAHGGAGFPRAGPA